LSQGLPLVRSCCGLKTFASEGEKHDVKAGLKKITDIWRFQMLTTASKKTILQQNTSLGLATLPLFFL